MSKKDIYLTQPEYDAMLLHESGKPLVKTCKKIGIPYKWFRAVLIKALQKDYVLNSGINPSNS